MLPTRRHRSRYQQIDPIRVKFPSVPSEIFRSSQKRAGISTNSGESQVIFSNLATRMVGSVGCHHPDLPPDPILFGQGKSTNKSKFRPRREKGNRTTSSNFFISGSHPHDRYLHVSLWSVQNEQYEWNANPVSRIPTVLFCSDFSMAAASRSLDNLDRGAL